MLRYIVTLVKDGNKRKYYEDKISDCFSNNPGSKMVAALYLEVMNYLTRNQNLTGDNIKERVLEQVGDNMPRGVLLLAFEDKTQVFLLCLDFWSVLSQLLPSSVIGMGSGSGGAVTLDRGLEECMALAAGDLGEARGCCAACLTG